MKLVLDQGLPRSVAERLRATGTDAVHLGELGMATAADSEVVTFARESGAVVVTLDADFHALLVRFGATHPSVIRLRVQGFSAEELTALIDRVLVHCREEIEAGAMVSSDGRRIRVRKLPLLL